MADQTLNLTASSELLQSQRERLHIVMFPWLAFGHMIPYLELAKLIAAKGHLVSFVSSARNIDRLPKVPTHLSRFLNLVKLQLPATDGSIIPNDAEATTDVPYDKVQYLKRAYDGLERQMVEFLEGERPDWILHDFAAYWVSSVAKKLGIGCAYFSIFIPALACMTVPTSHLLHVEDDRRTPEDFTVPPKWIPFETKVAFRYFEIAKIFDAVDDSNVSGITDLERANESTRGCDLMCVRGCSQLDGQWIQLAEKLHGKPVIPVGQLPTTPNDQEDDVSKTKEWLRIKAWLDQHEGASTVYVSFGSEAKPTQEEVTELAYGLEMSGLPFFWVLRTRRGSSDEDVVKLPEGFEERVAGRGVVYTTWVPQLKILSHESVGGFLSHAGWSSVVEALQYSKALILVPFLADQGINARVLEEEKMAYSVPRRERDGWFSRESVAESVRLVVAEEEGKAYRDKAKEMSKLFGDAAVQDGYVNSLLDYLQSHRVTNLSIMAGD